jgi:hypothetical protein
VCHEWLQFYAGPTAEVPLYGVAAAQRCLEEFDQLLEHAGTFGSDSWPGARRIFDVHRIANMLLAQDDIGLRLTGVLHMCATCVRQHKVEQFLSM